MDKIWENEEILITMRELVEKASKREAVCNCNYDIASDEWLNYIQEKYQKSLSDYELEMLNEKYTEERSKYPQRLNR